MGAFPNGYTHRKLLSIDPTKVGSFTGFFQTLVSHTDVDLKSVANGGKVQLNPLIDIRFEDTSGNKLPHEIVTYDPATGSIEAWVRLPSVSNSVATTYYIYFGKALTAETYQGIRIGYASATKMIFERNFDGPAGTENQGEVQAYVTGLTDPSGVSVTDPNDRVMVGQEEAGKSLVTGWVMYSEEILNTRFGMSTGWNDHLILVYYDGTNWRYDNNSSYVVFTPRASDFLIAEASWGQPGTGGRAFNYIGRRPAGEEKPWAAWSDLSDPWVDIGVVANNFRVVSHLRGTPDASTSTYDIADVNRFAMNFNAYNMDSSDVVDAKVGKGIDFDGFNDFLRAKYDVIWHASATGYISMWFKTDTVATTGCLFSRRTGVGTGDSMNIFLISGGLRVDFGSASLWTTGWTASAGVWYHMAVQTDGATRRLFINGVQVATQASAVGWPTAGSYHHVQIGASITDATNSGNFYDGIIDEFRLYHAVRDNGYFLTDYNNQNNPSTFYSIGSIATAGDAVSQDASHGQSLESVNLIEHKTLTLQDMAQGHFIDSVNLTQKHNLTVADLLHSHSLDALGDFTENTLLTIADLVHAHILDETIVVIGGTPIPDDMLQSHVLETIQLVQKHVLSVNDMSHANSLEAASLTQKHNIVVAGLDHAHTLDVETLVQQHLLAISDALHTQTVENPVLFQRHVLELQDAFHAHSLEQPFVYTQIDLVVQSILQGHSVDNITILIKVKPRPVGAVIVDEKPSIRVHITTPTAEIRTSRPHSGTVSTKPTAELRGVKPLNAKVKP